MGWKRYYGDRQTKFSADLHAHMEAWCEETGRRPPNWNRWTDGVHRKLRDAAERAVVADSVVLHGHAAHLRSSQTFAFNLFLSFREGAAVGLTRCRGKGHPDNDRKHVCREPGRLFAEHDDCFVRRSPGRLRNRRYWEIFATARGGLRKAFPGADSQWEAWRALLPEPGMAPLLPASEVVRAGEAEGLADWAPGCASATDSRTSRYRNPNSSNAPPRSGGGGRGPDCARRRPAAAAPRRTGVGARRAQKGRCGRLRSCSRSLSSLERAARPRSHSAAKTVNAPQLPRRQRHLPPPAPPDPGSGRLGKWWSTKNGSKCGRVLIVSHYHKRS